MYSAYLGKMKNKNIIFILAFILIIFLFQSGVLKDLGLFTILGPETGVGQELVLNNEFTSGLDNWIQPEPSPYNLGGFLIGLEYPLGYWKYGTLECKDTDKTIDSPDGNNLYVKGTLLGFNNLQKRWYQLDDFCVNSIEKNIPILECSGPDCQLAEKVCSPGILGDYSTYYTTCDCYDGACIELNEALCIDTDKGDNIFIQGTRTHYFEGYYGVGLPETDYCMQGNPQGFGIADSAYKVDSCSGDDCGIIEYICDISNPSNAHKGHACSNGCEDGACIEVLENTVFRYGSCTPTMIEQEIPIIAYNNYSVEINIKHTDLLGQIQLELGGVEMDMIETSLVDEIRIFKVMPIDTTSLKIKGGFTCNEDGVSNVAVNSISVKETICTEGETRCQEDMMETCSEFIGWINITCEYGCADGNCNSPPSTGGSGGGGTQLLDLDIIEPFELPIEEESENIIYSVTDMIFKLDKQLLLLIITAIIVLFWRKRK